MSIIFMRFLYLPKRPLVAKQDSLTIVYGGRNQQVNSPRINHPVDRLPSATVKWDFPLLSILNKFTAEHEVTSGGGPRSLPRFNYR